MIQVIIGVVGEKSFMRVTDSHVAADLFTVKM